MTTDWRRALAEPAYLQAQGLFVVEGREAIARLLRTSHDAVSLLLSAAAHAALAPALHGTRATVVQVGTAEMRELTGFNFHRGALAMVRRPPMLGVDDVLRRPAANRLPDEPSVGRYRQPRPGPGDSRFPTSESGPRRERPLFVVLEHLVDVDNVGSCFRNARAFGVSAVLLDERCADPLYRKAVRTSMGAVLDVPWTKAPIAQVLDRLDDAAVMTIGLTPGSNVGASQVPIASAADHDLVREATGTGRVVDLADAVRLARAAPSLALVVGNEGQGLSASTLARCTHRARIPMAAGADSLNVSTALAIALYEFSLSAGPEPEP